MLVLSLNKVAFDSEYCWKIELPRMGRAAEVELGLVWAQDGKTGRASWASYEIANQGLKEIIVSLLFSNDFLYDFL